MKIKKVLIVLVFSLLLIIAVYGSALAGGDQNHGGVGSGPTTSNCNSFGTCPWEP